MDTREKLIELIMASGEVCFTQSGEKLADHLIANGVTVQDSKLVEIDQFNKWIPVTERLPKTDKNVIVFCHWRGSWQVQVCYLSSKWEGRWFTSVAGQWARVTHWMPLPSTEGLK